MQGGEADRLGGQRVAPPPQGGPGGRHQRHAQHDVPQGNARKIFVYILKIFIINTLTLGAEVLPDDRGRLLH